MKRTQKHDNAHLTHEDRKVIQAGIENNSTKAAIARTIGKDATTVAKEIRNHRQLKPRNTLHRPILCAHLKTCAHKPCVKKCGLFEEPACTRRDKSPGACNKCEKIKTCSMDKYLYDAELAHKEYQHDLSDCREGIDLTTNERDEIARIIAPLLRQGQSVHQILSAHHEIAQCERTIYSYIENGVFKPFGVDNFSLKEQVSRRLFKEKYKKRKEPANYAGRQYSDYLRFRAENPDVPVVQMDTVCNSPHGPYLQTFLFEKTTFMIGFLHQEKFCANMATSLNVLQEILGDPLFTILFSLLLTDRGSEFEMFKLFELDSLGQTRLRMFFCDPMQSSQKPHVENNHNYIRDIIPNNYPLDCLVQSDIDLMFSHINSTPRRSLCDKTPLEVFSFLYGAAVPSRLNICEVERDNVVLKPSLLYSKHPISAR
jgi:transposase, IS30 family